MNRRSAEGLLNGGTKGLAAIFDPGANETQFVFLDEAQADELLITYEEIGAMFSAPRSRGY